MRLEDEGRLIQRARQGDLTAVSELYNFTASSAVISFGEKQGKRSTVNGEPARGWRAVNDLVEEFDESFCSQEYPGSERADR